MLARTYVKGVNVNDGRVPKLARYSFDQIITVPILTHSFIMASKPSAVHVQDVNTVNEWGDIEAQILSTTSNSTAIETLVHASDILKQTPKFCFPTSMI